jgi:hypothetical protein
MHIYIHTKEEQNPRLDSSLQRETRKERDEKEMVAEAHSVFISVMGQRKM